jgi:guanosine-diphosphatase
MVELDPPGRSKQNVTMVGTGRGSFEGCRRLVDVVIEKDALCEVEPCAFGGVWQPSMGETFSTGVIYAWVFDPLLSRVLNRDLSCSLSYFYDRINPLLQAVKPTSDPLESPVLTISYLRKLTTLVCHGPPYSEFEGSSETIEELEGRPEYCLDLSFMFSLLNLGYELNEDREIQIGKKLDGIELGWWVVICLLLNDPLTDNCCSRALGAALAMLDGELQCLA